MFLRSRRRVRTTFFFFVIYALFAFLAPHADGSLGTAPAAGVGPGALAPDRQATAVAKATVGTDLHQALDAESNLPAELALDLELLVDHLAQARHLFVAELADPGVGIDVGG